MNNKTKEILQTAGLTVIDDGVYGQRWYKSTCGLDLDEAQQLVDVIIQECMDAISKEASIRANQLTTDSDMLAQRLIGLVEANGVIRRQFGVE